MAVKLWARLTILRVCSGVRGDFAIVSGFEAAAGSGVEGRSVAILDNSLGQASCGSEFIICNSACSSLMQ